MEMAEWIDAKRRPYNFYDRARNRMFVKKDSTSTEGKATCWISTCAKATYGKIALGKWSE